MHPKDDLSPAAWSGQLSTQTIGRTENYYFEEIDSTNAFLKRLSAQRDCVGALCTAELQTAGRGRKDRSWYSPAGKGLWLSLCLSPDLPMNTLPCLTFCAALAARDAVAATCNKTAAIKWPNDIIVGRKKVCGILVETSFRKGALSGVIVGTGFNCYPGAYPEELRHQAAALSEQGDFAGRQALLLSYVAALEGYVQLLTQGGVSALMTAYRPHCLTLGQPVQVLGEGITLQGTAEDVAEDGSLLVRDDQQQLHRFMVGDVSVRGVMGYV